MSIDLDFWFRYFPEWIEFANPTTASLVPGTCFSYVASTFLNGWINYVKIDRAYLVTRYAKHAENQKALAAFHASPPFHVSFAAAFPDDVHVLARDEVGRWWWFWYDKDCSDCCVGILDPRGDDEETVRHCFEAYVNEASGRDPDEDEPALAIDASKIRGWVSG